LFSYRKPSDGWDGRLDIPQLFGYFEVDSTKMALLILGIFLTTFQGIVVMSFMYKYVLSTYYRLALKWENKANNAPPDEDAENSKLGAMANTTLFILELLFRTIVNFELLHNLANLTLSICGCAVHPLFFTYHAFVAAFVSKKLQAVLNAIIGPIYSIMLTLFLYMLMEYLFAIIGYSLFVDRFPDYTCASLIDCMLYIIDKTYKGDFGVGSTLDPAYSSDEVSETTSFQAPRMIYDFLFTLTITLVIVQLLSGLIIDKFRSLRKEAESREEDLRSSCIICSETSEIIERKTKESFFFHCNVTHNVWFYLMFIGYLMRKPKLDFTGVESYVSENFKKANVCWLPYSLYFCNLDNKI